MTSNNRGTIYLVQPAELVGTEHYKIGCSTKMTSNNRGTIYLVQPAELVGTEHYKIGCSAKNDLERFKKGYKKGTRFIIIMEVDFPFTVECEIKKTFSKKFELIAGKEYFKGNEFDIKKEFYEVVSKNNNKQNIVNKLNDINIRETQENLLDNTNCEDDKKKNHLLDFINEVCKRVEYPKDTTEKKVLVSHNKDKITERNYLIEQYNYWKKERGRTEAAMSDTGFTIRMKKLGIGNAKSGCRTYYLGLKLGDL